MRSEALGAARRALDPRTLLSRPELYELISEIGFIRVFAVFNDFVYRPLTKQLIWLLRNLSILLENARGCGRWPGSILVHAQKPPRLVAAGGVAVRARVSAACGVGGHPVPQRGDEHRPADRRLRDLYDEYLHEIIRSTTTATTARAP